MRKTLLFALGCAALSASAANPVFTTADNGSAYTFENLSGMEGSGVTKLAEKTYSVTSDIEVKANDALIVENGITVKMGKDVLIRMYGAKHKFVPADTATFTCLEAGVTPVGFHFTEMTGRIDVKHIRFETVGIRFGGPYPCLVESCTFYQHKGNKSKAAVDFVGSSVQNVVRGNYFYQTDYAAVASGSNVAAGALLEGNVMEDCSMQNRNYPVINMVVAGDNGQTVIRNNRVLGGKRTMPGALSVSNMLSIVGANEVIIENNYLDNSRYGINLLGNGVKVRVVGNTVLNCHYETNPNNGGSGLTASCTKADNPLKVYMQDNTIDGSIWGVTIVGPVQANLGRLEAGDDYNPGGNVFRNNGNRGAVTTGDAWDATNPYDLYNNSVNTVYAQGNTWGDGAQTDEEIEKRIYHKADNEALGQVIYSANQNSVSAIEADDNAGAVYYNLQGVRVDNPQSGNMYIRVAGSRTAKVLLQ